MQTILYVIYDNISRHHITQKVLFFMRCYITRAFSVCCSKYTFLFDNCILLVCYCKIYSI